MRSRVVARSIKLALTRLEGATLIADQFDGLVERHQVDADHLGTGPDERQGDALADARARAGDGNAPACKVEGREVAHFIDSSGTGSTSV